ncbi:FHA domain-containing protein, partial [Caldilinea sp.]|uniref:FHA domain-containing protein n=1 Tax=Caldilinea sp. TaxID=2293560 RepID=UPI002BB1E674|nr:FHA domain-containing protein [Caldilinea sp.]
GFTRNPADIATAVGRLTIDRERHGRTKLHDTLAGALAELRATDAVSKRLIVVSDGKDEGSDISQAALIDLAQADPSIVVNAVGFGALAESSSGPLATLAGATRGRFTIAASQATLASAIMQMIRQAVDMPQYDVTFKYAPDKDQREAVSAALLYRPLAGSEARLEVKANLAAAVNSDKTPLVAPPPNHAADATISARDTTPNTDSTQEMGWIERTVYGIPLLVWIGVGTMLLVLTVLLLRTRKSLEQIAPPRPPTIGPTKISPQPEPPPLGDTGPGTAPIIRKTLVSFRWPSPGDGRVVAILTIREGAAAGRQFPMTKAQLRIGAALNNDLVLEGDDFVSSHHVIFKAEGNALYVVDLGSRNGTALNGSIFKDATRSLLPGDQITLGRTLLEVESVDVPSQLGDPIFETRVP